MEREDIIRMAREWLPKAYRDGDKDDEFRFTRHNMEVAFIAGAAAEREACAKVAERQSEDEPYGHAKFRCANIAAAIRARGG